MSFDAPAQRALDTLTARGGQYGEIRFESNRTERIEARNGIVATLSDSTSRGYGIRAMVDGAWGFAASSDISDTGIDRTAARAVEIAKAGAAIVRGKTAALAPARAYVDTFATPIGRDPRDIPLGDRVALLLEAEKALHVAQEIRVGRAWIDIWTTDKFFYSSIGSRIQQSIRQTGSGIEAMAVGESDVQTRTFPGDIGLYKSGGWEVVEQAKLRENAPRIGEEAAALLRAPQCPSGTFDIILGGSQVSLQIHESCGHPAELDRVMGWEANFSGVSFLEINELGKLKYGSDLVNIVIDNTLPEGLATVGYDDEGTKSVVSDIIRDGVLVGYEMSNETAQMIGRQSNACVRAESWEYVPMIRMCNLNLLPGDTPFEHIFDDVRDGIYMESNRSWSIDDHRLNFQFGCEIAWEVKNGKLGRMVKNPTYGGITPQFWNSCDAIADKNSWTAWGTPNCGKGEPIQTGRTAQCAAPARFRNVAVGVGYRE
ncbi:MAG TPA: TldD/PmbA family protein [Candidatus Baltobacteraceae bacterium]|jgi:TldD protein|nr:TldD/PmbA family protein [Candidatus Baltobacteraceae bacterium]